MSKAAKAIENQEFAIDNSGLSITEKLWLELDAVYDRLKDPAVEAFGEELVFAKGEATAFAKAIAYMQGNPYLSSYPNIDAVRHECVERWEQRQERRAALPEPDTCATCGEAVEVRVDEAYVPNTMTVHECVL